MNERIIPCIVLFVISLHVVFALPAGASPKSEAFVSVGSGAAATYSRTETFGAVQPRYTLAASAGFGYGAVFFAGTVGLHTTLPSALTENLSMLRGFSAVSVGGGPGILFPADIAHTTAPGGRFGLRTAGSAVLARYDFTQQYWFHPSIELVPFLDIFLGDLPGGYNAWALRPAGAFIRLELPLQWHFRKDLAGSGSIGIQLSFAVGGGSGLRARSGQ
jgi:hypothetical protein